MPSDRDRSMLDELRQKNIELKEQLESEKFKNKQIHHEKVAEIKHLREQEQAKWEKEKISLKKKYLKEKNDAVNKILDNLTKKDKGVGDLLTQKDEEIKALHIELKKDSDVFSTSSYSAELEREKDKNDELRDQFETEKARLMQSMFELRTEKMRLEEEVDILKDSDRDKAIQLRQMFDQHQRDLVSLKRASALENRKQMEELRSVERRVMDKEKEISRKSKRLSQVEMSKEELQEKLNEQKLSERINLSMSMVDLNSSFSPHVPVIKPRGPGLIRSSSSFSCGKLSRSSSTASTASHHKPAYSMPNSPGIGYGPRPPSGVRGERKSADDKEKGLQQRNTELSMRIKQLEERIATLTTENDSQPHPGPDTKKRRISLSTICANLEERNQLLVQENAQLQSEIKDLNNNQHISMDNKPLEDKLIMQEKEKLLIERTLAHLLAQNNIKLPRDIRENIENKVLQLELDDALAEKPDTKLVEELQAKILFLEEDYQKVVADLEAAGENIARQEAETQEAVRQEAVSQATVRQEVEAILKKDNAQLREELSTLKEFKNQLSEQLHTAKSIMHTLSEDNRRLKQESRQNTQSTDSDRQARKTHDLNNEVKMLREEKQRFLDAEASTKQKIKLLEEVQMQLVKKEEQNSRYYDEVTQKLSLITQEKNDLAKRVEEYETQRRFEAEEMAAMLNDRNEYLSQLEKDKEYLRLECENYRVSNVQLEDRLRKMEATISPDNMVLVNRINELEEATEVVDALKLTNEDLKTHIRQYDAEKIRLKKHQNEELQRVIRTLDKKNKEHNQKSEELRSHIKRLEHDIHHLEHSKMENSGNLQIKMQELHSMSEYVKKLEDAEKELREKLELYQKSTVNGGRNFSNWT